MASYLDGGHPHPERSHLTVLFATGVASPVDS